VTIALTIGGRSEPGVISSSGNIPSSITGFPAVVVPAGFTAGGLPVGVEFLGAPFTEDRPTALAYHYQTATGHRRPPASTPSLPS
jgi:amidase